jgi:hypothetical protein
VTYGVGRFIQLEFYSSPSTRILAEKLAKDQSEVLRFYSLRQKEKDYM